MLIYILGELPGAGTLGGEAAVSKSDAGVIGFTKPTDSA
jgi:hypothetical protein